MTVEEFDAWLETVPRNGFTCPPENVQWISGFSVWEYLIPIYERHQQIRDREKVRK